MSPVDVGLAGECIESHGNGSVVWPGITDGTLAFGCKEVETESMFYYHKVTVLCTIYTCTCMYNDECNNYYNKIGHFIIIQLIIVITTV